MTGPDRWHTIHKELRKTCLRSSQSGYKLRRSFFVSVRCSAMKPVYWCYKHTPPGRSVVNGTLTLKQSFTRSDENREEVETICT